LQLSRLGSEETADERGYPPMNADISGAASRPCVTCEEWYLRAAERHAKRKSVLQVHLDYRVQFRQSAFIGGYPRSSAFLHSDPREQ
jgi:hypothetical protein